MPSKAAALARPGHPGSSVAVTIVTIGLGFGAGLDPFRLVVLGISMLAGQLTVGLSNDRVNTERDAAVGRRNKPIARGRITAGEVRNAALVSAALMVVLAIPLGWAADSCSSSPSGRPGPTTRGWRTRCYRSPRT